MTDAPKLLTEADIARYDRMYWPQIVADLRERGLIADEVDTLGQEASRLLDAWPENTDARWLALAALHRGMELAPAASPLTRERLADAIVKVFGEGERGFGNVTPNNITALHTALTERQP